MDLETLREFIFFLSEAEVYYQHKFSLTSFLLGNMLHTDSVAPDLSLHPCYLI